METEGSLQMTLAALFFCTFAQHMSNKTPVPAIFCYCYDFALPISETIAMVNIEETN